MKKIKKDIKTILFENMAKLNSDFNNESVDWENDYDDSAYREKANKIKEVIDKLFNEQEFEGIDALYRLLVSKKALIPTRKPDNISLTESHDIAILLKMLNKNV